MAVRGSSYLWHHFEVYIDAGKSGKLFKCKHCGAVVPSNRRWTHLKSKHREIWLQIYMTRKEEDRLYTSQGKILEQIAAGGD